MPNKFGFQHNKSCVVLFSGGQDSAIALLWALLNFQQVHTVGFHYGQLHSVELHTRSDFLAAVREWMSEHTCGGIYRGQPIGVLGSDRVTEMAATFQATASQLLSAYVDDTTGPDFAPDVATGLPQSFVPGRNLMFLLSAAQTADLMGVQHLVGGMCEADYSGYPDCREQTLAAQMLAINLGFDRPRPGLTLHTPLMYVTKADSWRWVQQHYGQAMIDVIKTDTHTCYRGIRLPMTSGFGCGRCPACLLRERGWQQYSATLVPSSDPSL